MYTGSFPKFKDKWVQITFKVTQMSAVMAQFEWILQKINVNIPYVFLGDKENDVRSATPGQRREKQKTGKELHLFFCSIAQYIIHFPVLISHIC